MVGFSAAHLGEVRGAMATYRVTWYKSGSSQLEELYSELIPALQRTVELKLEFGADVRLERAKWEPIINNNT